MTAARAATLTPRQVSGVAPISVSIIIATQRRPAPLRLAVASVLAQTAAHEVQLELVVVDNDERPSAREPLCDLAGEASFPVRYVHEPRSGVANARNAGVERARGELIAFLDDDEEAPPGWLAALLDAQRRFDADVVFAPVRARVPEPVVRHRPYFEHFFSRRGPAEAGPIDLAYGCGDSLIRRAALPHPKHPFSAEGNHTGGEDDLLFGAMEAAGARFCWAPEGWVWEDPAAERLNLAYTLRRAFVYGQGPSSLCAGKGDVLGVAGWMFVGAAQVALYGLAAAFKWTIGAPDRAFPLDRAIQGLGKFFWWGPFKIHFYGHPAPPETETA